MLILYFIQYQLGLFKTSMVTPLILIPIKEKYMLLISFFSHCPTICPAMTMNMVKLQKSAKDLNIGFVSFTVDPQKDSSERLLWYQMPLE